MAAAGEGGGGATADVDAGPVGVIVCDHGSRRETANTMLFEVAERYRSYSGFDIVEVGLLDLRSITSTGSLVSCRTGGSLGQPQRLLRSHMQHQEPINGCTHAHRL